MVSSVASWSSEKFANRLLKYLQYPKNVNDTKFYKVYRAAQDNDEVFEQLRIQSDQFAAIYPLLEGANYVHGMRLLCVLWRCAKSSASANLLAKEKRVWGFLVAKFEYAPQRCNYWPSHLIMDLIPYANKRTWKFAVESGILNRLLAEMQKKSHTCNSIQILIVILRVLSQPITQMSIDALISGGLFTLLEQQAQKSGNLLKKTPRCSECNLNLTCNFFIDDDVNAYDVFLLVVKKLIECFFCSLCSIRFVVFFSREYFCVFFTFTVYF